MEILLQIQPNLNSELFTIASFATLTGLSGMVFVICNSLQKAFNFNPKWLALLVAQILTVIAAYLSFDASQVSIVMHFFVAILNGFLVYFTSAGANNVGDKLMAPTQDTKTLIKPKRGFFTRWI